MHLPRHKAFRRIAAATTSVAVAAGLTLAVAPASSAATGNRSLAKVLTSDGNRFDHNKADFDIATEAVLAVLKAKPASPVSVLTKGSQRVTAFVPTDQAFRIFVYDLTGTWYARESKVFAAVASLGVDTVETVLLYHVVPGATITAKKALQSDGVALTTAQGGTFTVDVLNPFSGKIRLQDQDPNDVDPFTVPKLLNINKGNKQIAHGIEYVLRPADL
ncbi:MAG: fasciclin domain-containing protein [Actinomycetes bacterium]